MIWILLFIASAFSVNCTNKASYTVINSTYPFVLQNLPYTYDFLSPVLTTRIITLQHDSHQLSYLNNLNSYISLAVSYNTSYLSALVVSGSSDTTLEKYAGGLYNHYLYWWTLTNPLCANSTPVGNLATKINQTWGSFNGFLTAFQASAAGFFGNGWAWLCVNSANGLEIRTSLYQSNPLMSSGNLCYPVLGIDLWEHAYYLKYFSQKSSFVSSFLGLIDWSVVGYFYDNFASKLLPVPF